jgi:hypothetical protein
VNGTTTTTTRAKAVALAIATALLAAWALASVSFASDDSVSGGQSVSTSVVSAGKWPVTKGKKW